MPSPPQAGVAEPHAPDCRRFRRSALALSVALLAGLTSAHDFSSAHRVRSRMGGLPRFVLWAWERPEDLRFVDPAEVGIAFLASSIDLRDGTTAIRPRLQPLLVPEKARLVAVVRLNAREGTALSQTQLQSSVASIVGASRLPRVVAIQVDFDATSSQRAFYRDLLLELRRRLPADMPISITALASWCQDDGWISGLPIDEAVPMLFRMGTGANENVTRVALGRDLRVALCRGSLGISTDEPWPTLPRGRRVYAFRPSAWTPRGEQILFSEVARWR